MRRNRNRFLGCFAGLAVGDAVGAPLEFFRRGAFEPVTDMTEGGKLEIRKGEFTDDTSMALCLADSLVSLNGFDPADQMERYGRWVMNGKFSSRANAFGFGQTFMTAWFQYRKTKNPYAGLVNPKRPGNGCIMRLAPVPLFFYPDEERTVHYSGESSKTTHGMPESVYASRLFGRMLFLALSGGTKDEILFGSPPEPDAPKIVRDISLGAYRDKKEDEIESTFFAGKCLEAALWCFHNTDNYKEAVLKAANLGGDADSTAAVCGQIAGAHYGFENIPEKWVRALKKKEVVLDMANRLLNVSADSKDSAK